MTAATLALRGAVNSGSGEAVDDTASRAPFRFCFEGSAMTRLVCAALVGWLLMGAAAARSDEVFAALSPSEKLRIEIALARLPDGHSAPRYRVRYDGRDVVLDSSLGVELADGSVLGADCTIESAEFSTVYDGFRQHPGKRSQVVGQGSQTVVSFRERPSSRRWQVVARAYDDGVALRYRFPAQQGWTTLELAGERTTFAFPKAARAWALPLGGFTTSHEARYLSQPVDSLPKAQLFGVPLLVELAGLGWAAVTEADLTDYAGMYLTRPADDAPLSSRLAPLPSEPKLAVRAVLPHDSPWRVLYFAPRVERLIQSDLLLHLNRPSAVADVSWIKPGKTTFPWWNGYYEERVPFKPGLNTATVKHYLDFCAAAGIEYHSLDGQGNTAWYGGPIVPYEGADPTRAVAGLDLPEVLRYARQKGVRLRLWMHWQAAQQHMDRSFPLYRQWGIEGVMIDFMDRDDQQMIGFLHKLLKTAAENRLTVTFHGVSKPTGLERTWPNLLTSEGVMNLEYDKWDQRGIEPEHELTVPFTRMLAGPLDFHQGSLRTVSLAEFKPRNEAPLVIGTPCRTLASYVVYQNHLPMVADYPSAYRDHPALAPLASIPSTWDDTRAIAGVVGQEVVIARRAGRQWWIGAMTDRQGRDVRVPLEFLGPGSFRAEIYRDDPAARFQLARETRDLAAGDTIEAHLAPAGGLLVRLAPAAER